MTSRRLATVLPLALLSALLVALAAFSLQWRMEHDAPVMLYFGLLVDRFDLVPYRDFFDVNLPGSYLLSIAAGRFCDYGNDLRFRIFDVLWLGALVSVTALWMRRLGRQPAWAGGVFFGLMYLSLGSADSLQRDYLLLLPIMLGLLALGAEPGKARLVRLFSFGLLFGFSATVKPQAAASFPLVLLFQQFEAREQRAADTSKTSGLVSGCVAALLGFAAPLLLVLLYLWRNGALSGFLEMATRYWPLYTQLLGDHSLPLDSRAEYLYSNFQRLGGHGVWLGAALLGAYVALFRARLAPSQRRRVMLLGVLTAFYGLYPVLAGKFWAYHWLPFLYFAGLLASLCLLEPESAAGRAERFFAPAVLFLSFCLSFYPPWQVREQLAGRPLPGPKLGMVDGLVDVFREHLQPLDRVQPLDWTGGTLHAMLLTRVAPATAFVYDFHFAHHLSQPFIQSLRTRFLHELTAALPRFIVDVRLNKPYVSGPDTGYAFPDLDAFLASHYHVGVQNEAVVIYERN